MQIAMPPMVPICRSSDDEVDAALFDAGDDVGSVGGLFNEEVRPFEGGAQLFAQGGEVARQKNNGHWFSVAEREITSL